MNSILDSQYKMVCEAREVLLRYCETLSNEHLIAEFPNFGRGSIRNLLVHNANTYQFWIGRSALQKEIVFAKATDFITIETIRLLYNQVNDLMNEFLHHFENQLNTAIVDKTLEMLPLPIFTHVITHEFHHKGQILSMSRHLGYTPPDTDVEC